MRSIILSTIAIHSMAGGIEKNITLLANYLAKKGYQVSVITFDHAAAVSFFEFDERVEWYKTGKTKPHNSISFRDRLELIGRLRRILRRQDKPIVICFYHGILFRFMAAAFGLNIPFVCSERNSLSLYKHIKRSKKWSINFLLLALTKRITVQFPSYIIDYPFWLRKRIRVIPNPVQNVDFYAKPDSMDSNGRWKIIFIGRLGHQKNQKLLLEAFINLSVRFSDWDVYLIGDGAERETLCNFIGDNALSDRVFMLGKVKDVNKWLSESHLFCMPSKWEGFPNALAEAMACGLPSVGFASCAGMRDLIVDGKTGLLAAEDGLGLALEKLMSSAALRRDMGEAARVQIKQYSPENSFQKWDELLEEIENNRRKCFLK